jgi:hypothetical protein
MRRALVVAATMFWCASSLAQPTGTVDNWTAPPYWVPPSAAPRGSSEQGGREALASGRQPLATTSMPLPFVAMTPCRVADKASALPFATHAPTRIVTGLIPHYFGRRSYQ